MKPKPKLVDHPKTTTPPPEPSGHHWNFQTMLAQWREWWKDHHSGSGTTLPPGNGHPLPPTGMDLGRDRFPFYKSDSDQHAGWNGYPHAAGPSGNSDTNSPGHPTVHAAGLPNSAQQLIAAMAGFTAPDIGSLAGSVASHGTPPISIAASLH